MVSVVKEDRDALRFLWLDDISSDCPSVQVLRFTRIVFGVSASPFLLNATIKRHIEGYRSEDNGFVERSIYVDDVTFGAESAEKAFKLYQQSKLWLAKGGFNLRKFVTNCPELQSRINCAENRTLDQSDGTDPARVTSEDMSYVKNTLGDNLNNLEGLKVLGVCWNPESDLLLFDIQHITELATKLQPTKRNVIGLAARFFDPLGVISPVTVQFKLLFQNICVKNVSWDEPLPGELLERWEKLLDGLKQVHSITIPRCYFSNWTSCSLRGFCDSSQHAYAAVVYLQIETGGSCYSKLVVAKTRVCPLQKHSIPRLELLGALLLSRLLSWANSALGAELRLEPSICYTDSIVVLYWIKRVDKEWKQVVENFFAEQRIEWCFNLEKAPWWGGFFERMVGSVKRCLKKVIGHARLTFDELLTVIVEVEGSLNSRPLTYLSADDFNEPLTPAHLLTGRRLHGLPDTHVSSELDLDFVMSSTHSAVTSRMKHIQLILQHLWKRWKTEYLIDLREAHRFSTNKDKGYGRIALGDIVLVHDDNHP